MSTRRPLRGSPLLISAAGAVVTIASACGGHHPLGNLMAPPQVKVCVSVSPKAPVTINGEPLNDETGCMMMSESPIAIDVKLDGYEPYHEDVPLDHVGDKHDIVLVPIKTE